MAGHTQAGILPSLLKPKAGQAEQPEAEDWADKFAKVMEARRSGQKMREGKTMVLSKTWEKR